MLIRVVELPKTEEGLGFNVMGGKEQNSPIYISRIIPGSNENTKKNGRSRYWILKGQWRKTQLILELMRAFLSGTFTFYLLLLSPNFTFFHFYFLLLLLSPSFIFSYFDFFHISEFLIIRLNHVQVEWRTGMEVSSAGISCSVSTGWICKKKYKKYKKYNEGVNWVNL